MIRKLSIFTSIICLSFLLFGCTKVNTIMNDTSEEPPSIEENKCVEEKFYNFYTGIECSKDDTQIPAFMTIVENSSAARPQSGLSYADVLYETSAEGGIPRFLALFSTSLPSSIGPIRSVRPYFLDIVREFNLPFAHCGGSAEALDTIAKDNSLSSINEINQGSYFWRDSSRKAPHNLYTSSDNIKKYISDKSLKYTNSKFVEFDENYFINSTFNTAQKVNIKVNKTYSTSYEYKDGKYSKYMDSKKAIDTLNNSELNFSNIIVQKTAITLCSDNSHLNIPLIGKGEAFVFSKGKVVNAHWERASANSKTTLTDENNNTVCLSPGKTMWNIVDNQSKITIEN